jgi:Bacterial regulatory proteins, luxR family
VALVADGLSNREVARELGLSEHRVKKYLLHIFDKLGISSRVELVVYAVSHGGAWQAEWVAGGEDKDSTNLEGNLSGLSSEPFSV